MRHWCHAGVRCDRSITFILPPLRGDSPEGENSPSGLSGYFAACANAVWC
ncbi:Uncharacterised protein [Vibrio cholerae]|nr:Uncharacterised protein [Vibrio cholerae]